MRSLSLCCLLFSAASLATNLPAFDPAQSSSFKSRAYEWAMKFTDGSHLTGYVVTDVVHLGDSHTSNKFQWALIRKVEKQQSEWVALRSNGVSGILGLGYPRNSSIIREPPIFYWLKDSKGKPLPRVFSIFMTAKQDALDAEQDGALVLGGYDNQNYDTPRFWTHIDMAANKHGCEKRLDCGYWLSVRQLTFGSTTVDPKHHTSLLKLDYGYDHILALPDSGTSCLTLPRGSNGAILNRPYDEWINVHSPGGYNGLDPNSAFYVELLDTEGKVRRVEIPLRDYVLRQSEKECVTEAPEDFPDLLILGAPLFRAAQLTFDLSDDGQHKIGFSFRRPKGHTAPPANPGVVSLPLQTTADEIYYSTTVRFGTPPQTELELIVDTGSSVVAAFEIPNGGLVGRQVFPAWAKGLLVVSSALALVALLLGITRCLQPAACGPCAALWARLQRRWSYSPLRRVQPPEDDEPEWTPEANNHPLGSSDEDIL